MLYHRKRKHIIKPSIFVNNVTIERVHRFNFLELTLNTKLTWKDHLDIVSMKLLRAIAILNSLRYSFPIHILLTIYNTFISFKLRFFVLWSKL